MRSLLIVSLATFIVLGLVCLVFGVLFIKSQKKMDNGSQPSKATLIKGWKLVILGSIMIIFFVPALIKASLEGDGLLGTVWLFSILFLPFVLALIIALSVFPLIIGITSLQTGYKNKKEGKNDKLNLVFGYIVLCLVFIAFSSMLWFVMASWSELFASFGTHNDSSSPNETVYAPLLHR